MAFTLYDTYGFPIDLTRDILRGRDITIDEAGFEAAMDEQREKSKSSARFAAEAGDLHVEADTHFTGHETLNDVGRVLLLFKDGKAVQELKEGETGQIVLVRTPFYAESGGQVGDTGTLNSSERRLSICSRHEAHDCRRRSMSVRAEAPSSS